MVSSRLFATKTGAHWARESEKKCNRTQPLGAVTRGLESSTDVPKLIMPQPCTSERPSLGTESTAQDRALFPPKGSAAEPREEKREREKE